MKKSFSKRLVTLRQEKKLKQEELAKKLKLATSTISMYERGSRIPSLKVLERIADFFNVDLDFLLGKKDEITVLPNNEHIISNDSKSKKIQIAARKMNDLSEKNLDLIITMMEQLGNKEGESK